jgi:hypothetical protein
MHQQQRTPISHIPGNCKAVPTGSLAGLQQDVPTKEADRAIVRPVQEADAFGVGLNDTDSLIL